MNKQGKTMTSFVIALLAFVAVISIATLANNEFIASITPHSQDDNVTYESSLSNLSSYGAEGGTLDTEFTNPLKSTNILGDVFRSGSAIITTAIIGIGTIQTLLIIPGMLNGIFLNITSSLGLGEAGQILLWFFTSAAFIWFTMKVIQSIRGTGEPA